MKSVNSETKAESMEKEIQHLRQRVTTLEEALSQQNFESFLLNSRTFCADNRRLRVALLGTCQVDHLYEGAFALGHTATYAFYNPSQTPFDGVVISDETDAVVVGITLRNVMAEACGGAADVILARGSLNADEIRNLVERCAAIIKRQLEQLKQYTKDTPTFVLALLEPTFNYIGELIKLPMELRPKYFVRTLNENIESILLDIPHYYYFDYNDCFNAIGTIHLRDDSVIHCTHASIIDDWYRSFDEQRLIKHTANTDIFNVVPFRKKLHAVVFDKLETCVGILHQKSSIKLIVVDLDDTLWRGVAAEDDVQGWERTEGWPLGLVEALLYFKRRGGLLAICSKNDRQVAEKKFQELWGGRISIEDFASVKIGWGAKSEAVTEILAEVNVLAEHVAYIDDNPREIDEVKGRFPQIRALTGRHHDWRRVILRSPEMQVAMISSESARRTDMVRAAIERNASGKELGREEWLNSLNLQQRFELVRVHQANIFARCLELINKTNQFNTTGVRWSAAELTTFLCEGGLCIASWLTDRSVDSGIIGVALIKGGEVVQIVLSCRAFGLGAELALGAIAVESAARANPDDGARAVRARFVDTGRNHACLGFFEEIGFGALDGGVFSGRNLRFSPPSWIQVTIGEDIIN